MFEKITNKNKLKELQELLDKANQEVESLNKELDSVKVTTQTNSSITFFIDKDLTVKVTTRVNKEIGLKLLDEALIDEKDVDNHKALALAILILANEATDQLISEYMGDPVEPMDGQSDAEKSDS